MKTKNLGTEKSAWEKFTVTGRVEDYLSYALEKEKLNFKEKMNLENKHHRPGDL